MQLSPRLCQTIPTQLLVCEVVATTRSWLPTLSWPKRVENTFLEMSHGSDVPHYHGDIRVIQLTDGVHGNVCSVEPYLLLELVMQRIHSGSQGLKLWPSSV